MGKRGPRPVPNAVLRARGSRLLTRERLASEVVVPDGIPVCPDWLDADAKATWNRVAPLLTAMGVLTLADEVTLARYCRLWSRWRKLDAFLDEKGAVYPLKDGSGRVRGVAAWPQATLLNQIGVQLNRLEAELGLTPSGRARLAVNDAFGRWTHTPSDPQKPPLVLTAY